MTETTAVPLEIPDDVRNAAYHALLDARARQLDLSQASVLVIEAVSASVVAAELRARVADLIETELVLRGEAGFVDTDETKAYRRIALALGQRADELSPPT